jgi:hypothetical protein
MGENEPLLTIDEDKELGSDAESVQFNNNPNAKYSVESRIGALQAHYLARRQRNNCPSNNSASSIGSENDEFRKHRKLCLLCKGDVLKLMLQKPGVLIRQLIRDDNRVLSIAGLKVCASHDAGHVLLAIRAFVAIVSSILFWVGAQDYLLSAFEPSLDREVWFSIIGLVLIIVTDTL